MLKVSVKKKDIVAPLTKAQTIVDKKTVMTVINSVFIYTKDGELFIEATDLEINFRSHFPCDVLGEGSITINAKKLYELLREFSSEEIILEEMDNSRLLIRDQDKSEYKLAGMPPDDFPSFKPINSEIFITVPPKDMTALIDKTLFCVSTDETKFGLTGILFEQTEADDGTNVLRTVSSDGHRLSLKEIPLEGNRITDDAGFILPRKASQELRKLAEGANEPITFGRDEDLCFAITGADFLTMKLAEGRFPDYRRIIPGIRERVVAFNRLEVHAALKRISIVASDSKFKGIKVDLKPDIMKIESLRKEKGEADETIRVDYDGEPFELALNLKYMMDALSVMESDTVELTANSPDVPCMLTGENDKGYLAIIMPISTF